MVCTLFIFLYSIKPLIKERKTRLILKLTIISLDSERNQSSLWFCFIHILPSCMSEFRSWKNGLIGCWRTKYIHASGHVSTYPLRCLYFDVFLYCTPTPYQLCWHWGRRCIKGTGHYRLLLKIIVSIKMTWYYEQYIVRNGSLWSNIVLGKR